jgi:hypothetical protein
MTTSEKIFNIVFNYIIMVLFIIILPLLLIFFSDVRKLWSKSFILETVAEKMNE